MNLLALETSCEKGSIALYADGALATRRLTGFANHSEYILQEIASLLAEHTLPVSRLDAIAFGCGPGAFTGLRLACGVAQGLALGADKKVIPVNSLAALALQGGAGHVLAATDARMGQVYCGFFIVEANNVVPCGEIQCLAPEEIELPAGNWCGIGSAFAAYQTISERMGGCLDRIVSDAVPRADEIALLALNAVKENRLVAPEDAALLYVRDKVAYTTAERLTRGGKR